MNSMPPFFRIIHGCVQLFLLMLFSLFWLSCGNKSATIKKSDIQPLRIINSTISKDIKETATIGEPASASEKFKPDDEKVVSHVGFAHLTGRHQIRWEWYTPDGDLYQSTGEHPLEASDGEYVKAGATSHSIGLKGHNAAASPGQWRVKIYLDNALAVTETFSLSPPEPKAPPLISVTSPTSTTVNQRRITVNIALTDQGGGVGKLVWKLNGRQVKEEKSERGVKIKPNASKKLTLIPGRNRVEVTAYNEENTTASPAKIIRLFYHPTDVLKGWYTRQYAVVVGIDNYKSNKIDDLNNAVNDAEAISNMLKKMGFVVHELYNRRASKKNIRDTIAAIRRDIHQSDSFCFYFAGHGQGISLKNNDREGYIIPYDADIDLGNSDIMQYDDAAISLSRLQKYLEDTRAKHISLLLDSCFSGLAMQRAVTPWFPDDADLEYYQDLLARKAMNILTAGDDQRVSDGTTHSPFAQAILNGLDKGNLDIHDRDGFVTFNQLAPYVKEKVEKKTCRKQRPQFDNLSMDDGDFIFKLSPTALKTN